MPEGRAQAPFLRFRAKNARIIPAFANNAVSFLPAKESAATAKNNGLFRRNMLV